MKHTQKKRTVLSFLVFILLVLLAHATPSITKVEMAAQDFFQVSVMSKSPEAQKALGPDSRPTFKVPSLEIFNPEGTAVFYNNDTPTVVKTLQSLHSNVTALKPVEGYASLEQLLGQLRNGGAQNLEAIGRKKVYTFIVVGLSGDQCKPCKDVDSAMAAFLKERGNADYDILELTLNTTVRRR